MKNIVFISLFLLPIFLFSQSKIKDNNQNEIYYIVDEPPKYNGSSEYDELYQFVNTNLIYPQSALQNCIQGTVVIGILIDSIGNVDSLLILRSLNIECDNEAIRLFKMALGHWTAGKKNNVNVKTIVSIPVKFEIKTGCKDLENYYISGYKKFKKKEYHEAILDFDEILKKRPLDQEILLKRGISKIKIADINGACNDFHKSGNKKSYQLIKKYCKN